MDATFWKGRRVLLTGHTGFKGSWLSLWLRRLGADVVGYARKPHTNPSLFEVADVGRHMTSIEGDVCDLERLRSVVTDHRPEVILHLAAQALVRASYSDPVGTYRTNVLGTVNLLEAARGATDGLRAVVVVTSDKCYENRGWVWGYRECDPMGGHDPYSNSKGCAELIVSAYRKSFFPIEEHARHGVGVASARAGNVIGGGDWAPDRLVPDILEAIADGRPVQIRRPNAIRPWQFVLEPLAGYLLLAERLFERGPEFARGWNFGPAVDDTRPVAWITDLLTKRWGNGARWEHDGGEHPHEDRFLTLDTSQSIRDLGWKPRLDLGTALEWIVEWHRAFRAGNDLRTMTEEQIRRYEQLGETNGPD